MGQRQDKEEIARVMQQLRKEEKVAEEAQMAEVLAKGLPACLRELGGKTSDERRATFEASFAAVAREDEDRRAPRPAAPPTETAATDWTADDHRAAFIRLEMTKHVPMAAVIDDQGWVAAASPPPLVRTEEEEEDTVSELGAWAATADGSSAQLRPGRCPVAWANQEELSDVVNNNVIVKPKPPRPTTCGNKILHRMTLAVCEQQGGVCKRCQKKRFEIKDGKVTDAHLDHLFPLSLLGVCPLFAAQGEAARLAVAKDETVFQVLCEPCHRLKTNEDNLLAAQAATSTLFWLLFEMPLPWTVDALTALFPHDTMQDRLRKMFEADLAEAGETLQDYELGANLMPVFKCWKCGKRTESRYFTWAQDVTEQQKTRRVRATILKPTCRCGNSSSGTHTIPVTFHPTRWPHYSNTSANEQLNYLRSSRCLGWLLPKNEEQVAKWREKIERGVVWFRAE